MKIMIAATAALALTGSALAYQTYTTDAQTTVSTTPPAVAVSIDPTVAFTPPTTWTPVQVALWEEQMTYHPGWTAEQRAAFEAMMGIPPANWTAEQRVLYQEHLTHIPPHWTAEQRAMFETQIAGLQTPWAGTVQTATTTTAVPTTVATAPVGDRIHEPSNANPERDARGIAVISDAAVVPPGYNGFTGTAMGGPLVDPATGETIDATADATYPACSATVTDNCIQLYERGVRASLASWNRSTGATGVGGPIGEDELGDNTPEDDVLDIDTEPDGDIDVDGDLDNDGDNDLE